MRRPHLALARRIAANSEDGTEGCGKREGVLHSLTDRWLAPFRSFPTLGDLRALLFAGVGNVERLSQWLPEQLGQLFYKFLLQMVALWPIHSRSCLYFRLVEHMVKHIWICLPRSQSTN